ncbi:MAG: diguanylate cyclase [Defluviitaleaceae bacterium]|nr:diguanylate cyclase [Defluviitaleaceae bacterium]
MNESHVNTILVVDDETENIAVLDRLLGDEYTIYASKNGEAALTMAQKYLPDLILLDIIMPDIDGYEVLSRLRKMDETKNIPIIFITGLSSVNDEERGLELDAADYISKPFKNKIVKLRVRNQIKIVNAMRTIEHLSNSDALTGIANRRSFTERLNIEWSRAVRDNAHLTLIIADVDYFKRYNDTYGHVQGDVALKTVANVMSGIAKRDIDMAARWGGEEFALLLPSTDPDGALLIAEKLRTAIENKPIPADDKESFVTISLGVNSLIPTADSVLDDFIVNADKALYAAKEQGRNKVCIHS